MHLLFAVLLVGHWLAASDLHVEPGQSASVPAPYGKDTNWALFDATVAAMGKADPKPQVVILSGDLLAHHFPHNVALAESTMARIAHAFDAAFPHAQFLIVPGNNDDPCGDYRATPGGPYFAYLAHLWEPLVNRNGAAPHFEHDFAQYGWYTARLPDRLQAIALDSVYWSIVYRRCSNAHPDAPQLQQQWFAQSLRSLRNGERAVVIMHIPPGVDATSTLTVHRLLVVPFWRADMASSFVRTLSQYQSKISYALTGHVHRDDFRIFAGVPMLVAPSISPVYQNNPAFLRLDVSADGTLQDYTPIAYDEWNEKWVTLDSFDSTFGVKAFTAQTLSSIHDRLGADEALRSRWSTLFVSGSDDREIREGTWRTYWCAQTELAGGYGSCAGLRRRLELLPIAFATAGVALLALVAILLLRLGRARRSR